METEPPVGSISMERIEPKFILDADSVYIHVDDEEIPFEEYVEGMVQDALDEQTDEQHIADVFHA